MTWAKSLLSADVTSLAAVAHTSATPVEYYVISKCQRTLDPAHLPCTEINAIPSTDARMLLRDGDRYMGVAIAPAEAWLDEIVPSIVLFSIHNENTAWIPAFIHHQIKSEKKIEVRDWPNLGGDRCPQPTPDQNRSCSCDVSLVDPLTSNRTLPT